MTNKIQNRKLIYGDWRDEVIALNIPLNMPDSKYASPMCPKHGWLTMRKKKINIWECSQCHCRIELDEQIYRAWRKKNCNNLFSKVPPIHGSKCARYLHPENPKQMEGCQECMQSFGRCLVEMQIIVREKMEIKMNEKVLW